MTQKFPSLPSPLSLPAIDREILGFWDEDRTFEASVESRPENDQFVFYDGPPFANGLPHYGHLLTGFVKDVIPRYQTMKGKRVERRFGWDTHGLPAELAAEKEIGVSGRKAVLDLGIDKFNDACRTAVLRYTEDWEEYIRRSARWVDTENAYKTLDVSFMESCIWAFKQLYDKGLVYKDYRVVPYSWAVESPLSNFETRLDNSYRMRTDPAVTVAFALTDGTGLLDGARVLIWTTTPWTLPSNLAIAVGEDITYAVMGKGADKLVLSANGLEKYKKELEGYEKLGEVSGAELKGLHYTPPFDYFLGQENAFRVLSGDFVVDEDGTGIVHMAPGFGEDDLKACKGAGIGVVVPVDHTGRYTSAITDYEGMLVFDANKPITQRLKDEGKLIRHDTIDHNYPHCWRTDEPLIYKAVESWYLEVSKFRERMVELNQQIDWTPPYVKDGLFGNWLSNAQDWNISRSRFWGTPIPVWVSDNPDYPRVDVYGSIDELQADFGTEVTDLHRPYVDDLVRPNPDDPTGKSMMRRVEDVFDCWFESGSMPYAAVHYPFENKDWFEANFPADFIVEYVAQTRGWFYTLMVLGTMLFDSPPFKSAICHGVVLDENRQKLSKRLRNYPDPLEFFNEYGSDVMRWFLISSPVLTGGDLLVPKEGREVAAVQREAIAPLLNAYAFFSLYANLETRTPQLVTRADDSLDRYILTKTGELAAAVAERLDAYDVPGACRETKAFTDALTNWYIRRSRARFWGSEDAGAQAAAFDTLYTVLVRASQIVAPLMPIIAEKLYKSLTGERSVHLTDWPASDLFPQEHDLVAAMDRVREACSATLAVRERFRLRVRLPLKSLVIAHPEACSLDAFKGLIAEEVNVREVIFAEDLSKYGELQMKVNPVIGRRLGAKMKDVMTASRNGEFTLNDDGTAVVAEETLGEGDFEMRLESAEGTAAEPFDKIGAAVLDVSVDADQESEGLARDLIRAVQTARKEAGLDVSDRILLGVEGDADVAAAIDAHGEMIKSETLAVELNLALGDGFTTDAKLTGQTVKLSVKKTD
ncbi:MAG: isoleucine--tRNA ligase [Rhodobacterales bacterium CG15_BIG_FIL_POST_REV_8_21_14_020_59_13]|nr:MAG: isoleucine--tRNA ligase [Rhodobacterales bacterium CG15_BIG_FIL_POST_REV_8_21_14_020_59_13]